MFGGAFFPPSEVRNGNVTIATAGQILGSSSEHRQESGLPQPLCTPCGAQRGWGIPAPQPSCLRSQQVYRHEKQHGQKIPETHRMLAVLLVKDTPNHLNTSWFLLPSCSGCLHRAGSSLLPSIQLHQCFQG